MISIDFERVPDEDEEDYQPGFFIDHLRKCFIATDNECFCENIIVPQLEIQLKTVNDRYSVDGELWRTRLSNFFDRKNYDYLNSLSKLHRSLRSRLYVLYLFFEPAKPIRLARILNLIFLLMKRM
jgi:hypothetical protein